jgi:hypothetical protein
MLLSRWEIWVKNSDVTFKIISFFLGRIFHGIRMPKKCLLLLLTFKEKPTKLCYYYFGINSHEFQQGEI